MRRAACVGFVLSFTLFCVADLAGESVPVTHQESTVRGFLKLMDDHGRRLADGDVTEVAKGDRVTFRLIFRFRDGSVDDDRSVFTQHGVFKLLHDHHVQTGPSFPHPIDVAVDTAAQAVTTRSEKDGKVEVNTQHMDLPEDVANGILLTLVRSISPQSAQTKVAYVATTPKPRLVHLAISPGELRSFTNGRQHYKAACFVFHAELGGITGLVAPLSRQAAGRRPRVGGGGTGSCVCAG